MESSINFLMICSSYENLECARNQIQRRIKHFFAPIVISNFLFDLSFELQMSEAAPVEKYPKFLVSINSVYVNNIV